MLSSFHVSECKYSTQIHRRTFTIPPTAAFPAGKYSKCYVKPGGEKVPHVNVAEVSEACEHWWRSHSGRLWQQISVAFISIRSENTAVASDASSVMWLKHQYKPTRFTTLLTHTNRYIGSLPLTSTFQIHTSDTLCPSRPFEPLQNESGWFVCRGSLPLNRRSAVQTQQKMEGDLIRRRRRRRRRGRWSIFGGIH